MGRSITPKYRVEFVGCGWTPMGWNSKQAGRPTAANLAAFVKGYEDSTLPGGCNAHLGATKIAGARILLNVSSPASVVATYVAR